MSCPIWSTVLQCGAQVQICTENYWTVWSVMLIFYLRVWLSVILLIVYLWKYYACCGRSGVIRFTLFMVRNLCHICQSGFHVMLWSHIGMLMHHLAAGPHSAAGLLLFSQCFGGTILLTLYLMVWDWLVLLSQLQAIIMTTSTEDIASGYGIQYLEPKVPTN